MSSNQKVIAIGNELGFIIPPEWAIAQHLQAGATLNLTATATGFLITVQEPTPVTTPAAPRT